MISTVRTLAAVVVTLAAVLIWLAPGLEPPAAARASDRVTEAVREVTYEDCTFRLINRYDADEQIQSALTRQVRTEACHFGDRNGTILVRACYEAAGADGPADCSAWLRPTSDAPYAESEVARLVPRDSIHYVEIRGEVRRFDLAAPEVAPAPPPPPPDPAPPPPAPPPPQPPPAAARTPTEPATDDPGPPPTTPAGGQGVDPARTSSPERWEAASRHTDTRYGLAASLAAGGVALLGLGGAGIWLLRRGRPDHR